MNFSIVFIIIVLYFSGSCNFCKASRGRGFPLTIRGSGSAPRKMLEIYVQMGILECKSLMKLIGQMTNIAFITASVHLNIIVPDLFFS